jgi:PAS domain S-box-containing protein
MIHTPEQYKEYLKSRLEPVSDILPGIVSGDFSRKLEIPAEEDEFTELYIGINFLVRDLEEQLKMRKSAEEALSESEQKYKMLFDTSPEGILIIDLDGKVLDCNAAVYNLTNIPEKDLIGKQFMDLGLLDSDQLSKIIKMFPRLLCGDFNGTVEVEIPSGDEKRYLEAFPAVIEKDNEINALQIIVRDITERKRAEKALKEKVSELEQFKKITVDREIKMIELKEKVKELRAIVVR